MGVENRREDFMKRIVILMLFLLMIASFVHAEIHWYVGRNFTVAWDPVTVLEDGNSIPDGSAIKYVVMISDYLGDPDKLNPQEYTGTYNTQFNVEISEEGHYLVGVKAQRVIVDLEEIVTESEVSWSDDPLCVQDGIVFGRRYYLPPGAVKGIHPVP